MATNLIDNKEFKMKLIEKGITMKQFCMNHSFPYGIFNLYINNLTNTDRKEFEEAIVKFINE